METVDLFVIGGGVNGCGIATKLFHGGLRYLEFFEIGLVRSALKEREVLLRAMPHISWPMRFVLPFSKEMRFDTDTPVSKMVPFLKGRRPKWMIRAGLFAYDHLGGRKILPATKTLDLTNDPAGEALQDRFETAFEYSDCWVEDSRLVVLNARDAEAKGARILTRTEVTSAERVDGLWHITTDGGTAHRARKLVNAGGPWVADIVKGVLRRNASAGIRLVRGSHIVTRKLFDHDRAYFLQGTDGRIIFAIPYETDFTLIGTTDVEQDDLSQAPECSPEETAYLCEFASAYFKQPVTPEDVVWTYSGVRPLYDDGVASATAATRDYVLEMDIDGPPLLNVFGGKITTYRKLSEQVVTKLWRNRAPWTAGVALPGGDFAVDGVSDLIAALCQDYPFLTQAWATRLVKAYGTDARDILGDAKTAHDLGTAFGGTLTEAEVTWLQRNEYVKTADDILWRRSKLGLHMTAAEQAALKKAMGG